MYGVHNHKSSDKIGCQSRFLKGILFCQSWLVFKIICKSFFIKGNKLIPSDLNKKAVSCGNEFIVLAQLQS